MSELPRVLLISSDTVGPHMAGSGIRYWNFARVIGSQQPATLATPEPVAIDPPPGVSIVPYGPGTRDERGRRLAQLVAGHDVVVAQHLPYHYADEKMLATKHLVVDLYAPWILEKLEYARVDPERGEPNRSDDVEILNRLLALGDFFLCASERQRDFWLGALSAAGRLGLAYLQRDPELRSLVDVVPFGLPDTRPIPNGPGPREIYPRISERDPIILWNGGLWNWLDPLTAISATAALAERGRQLRLIFMGARSPVAEIAEMGIVDEARELATSLGLLDKHVYFNDWVPYEERQNWLLQATATLSLHTPTVESRYAFRTRVLDNLWCGVPVIATEGDVLADLVRDERIGMTVPPGDASAVAEAIETLLDRDNARAIRSRIAAVAKRYTWEQVAAPLARYCAEPWKPDNQRSGDPRDAYIHKLERLYTETAGYARDLERAIDEKNRALKALSQNHRSDGDPWLARLSRWRRRI